MSTNYYLINKQEEAVHTDFINLIQSELVKLNNVLVAFCEKNDLDKEEVDDKVKAFGSILRYDVFSPRELPICFTTAERIVWRVNECYYNVKTFVDFYKKNSDTYYIKDENENEFSIEQFLSIVHNFK